jgi:hypothetical protein
MGALGFGLSDSIGLQEHREVDDAVTAEERAEWLIDYILLHQGEGRIDLIRRAVDQFLEAEAVAYERGRRGG